MKGNVVVRGVSGINSRNTTNRILDIKGEVVGGWIAGVWAVIAAALFFASYFSSDAASFEPAGRYLYVYILLFSLALIIIAVLSALGVLRPKRGGE